MYFLKRSFDDYKSYIFQRRDTDFDPPCLFAELYRYRQFLKTSAKVYELLESEGL